MQMNKMMLYLEVHRAMNLDESLLQAIYAESMNYGEISKNVETLQG